MKILMVCCCLIAFHAMAQKNETGLFTHTTDIGNPQIKGSASYDEQAGTYTLKGGGYNIWFNRDELHIAYKKLKGNFVLTAYFELQGTGTDPHRKTGWMVRESLADTAMHISAVAHGDGLMVMQWRAKPGMNMRDPEDEIFAPEKNYKVLELERSGNRFIIRAAVNKGEALHTIGEHTMDNMPEEIIAGIFICSHNPAVAEEVKIKDVKIKQ